MLLEGKVVLVTGGGRNVGAGIVRSLAREGAMVIINYLQNEENAKALAESLREQGRNAGVWQCDVTNTEAVQSMIACIVAKHGRIDAIVNNASCTRGGGSLVFEENNWQIYLDEFEHSVKAVINTVQSARPFMKEQGGGRIVNIVTEQWNEAWSGGSSHVTGKAAMVGLARWLVRTLGEDNITINQVAPGWTRTDRTQGRDTPDHPYMKWTPLKRMAEAEEVGDACVFFISDLGKYISGAYLQVNGGRHPQMGN